MLDYDLELRRHHAAFRGALDIARSDQVLDLGCGAGETTREAARAASEGGALGVDRSQPMIERARALVLAEELANIAFETADVERYPFSPGRFDLAISRFGTMFFADPAAAFRNICLALKPRGRLVMMVWQSREQNEWAKEIERAVGLGDAAEAYAAASVQAFSLGAPDQVRELLQAAGFCEITFAEVREPVCYGLDIASAVAFVMQFLSVREALKALSFSERARAEERLHELLASRCAHDGVWFDSRAWIVRARRA